VLENQSLEISEPNEIRKTIDEACRPLTAVKTFKANIPDDWDSTF
jgi:hypothetical protein